MPGSIRKVYHSTKAEESRKCPKLTQVYVSPTAKISCYNKQIEISKTASVEKNHLSFVTMCFL